MKINHELKGGKLYKVTRGIYEDNPTTDSMYLAGVIYGPSYLSFDFALYFYDLIPEAVFTYTSATTQKRRSKVFSNHFGTFTYQDVPEAAFPYGVNLIEENGYSYMIATPEKALCDKLYTLKPVTSLKELKYVLFTDLRIEEEDFYKLNMEDLIFLCPLYKSKTLNFLLKFIKGEML
ncbi:MAG: hypothetical protein LUD22_03460 [Coprobacillus sp.]|nr:hypothetical protein [Coprobacillus sp.]